MPQFKQVIVLRDDLEMSKGKTISQACHASLKAYKKADNEIRQQWESEGSKKIILRSGQKDLTDLNQKAKKLGIPASLIKDAGETELEPGTKTALGLGPEKATKIDKITGELQLVN